MLHASLFRRFLGMIICPARALSRLARETRSDTAVEFAMIGSAFFVFVFAIFVVAINQFWQMTLDEAVRNAARQVQIGHPTTGLQFVADVCNTFGIAAPNCSGKLQYNVVINSYFGTSAASAAIYGSIAALSGTGLSTNSGYPALVGGILPGSSTTVTPNPQFLLVQVAYPVPYKIFLLPGGLATQNGTPYLYSAVTVDMEPGA